MEAAERLLTSGGFGDASVSDLAREAGLSRASFYFYFASKQALLSAVIADAISDFRDLLRDQLVGAAERSPGELISGTVAAAVDLWWEHRQVMVSSVELGCELPQVYDRTMATIEDVGARTMSLLREAGYFADVEHEAATADMVTALILMTERNFYDLARHCTSRPAYDELGARLTTIWLRALEVPRSGP